MTSTIGASLVAGSSSVLVSVGSTGTDVFAVVLVVRRLVAALGLVVFLRLVAISRHLTLNKCKLANNRRQRSEKVALQT
jgi:hypothetical protein